MGTDKISNMENETTMLSQEEMKYFSKKATEDGALLSEISQRIVPGMECIQKTL